MRSIIGMADEYGKKLSEAELKSAVDNTKSGRTNVLCFRWQKEIYNDSSVCCFSRTGDSIQMFAYYADDQKGISIEFSFSNIEADTKSFKLNIHDVETVGRLNS